MDKIDIDYAFGDIAATPNLCKADTTYKGQTITAHGATWAEAKQGAVNQCEQLKALGTPPATESVDLDAPAA